jgi:uncharacterized membrane protein (UPF0182 family)
VTVAPVGGNNGGRNSTLASSGTPIDPLYLMMQLPGEKSKQEFVLERPFIPRSKSNQLSSFLVARNDGKNYGKLILYQTPDQSNVPSPARAASLIEADPQISAKFSLLDQLGSKVVRGATQLVPMGNSLIYVRPIYVEGQGSQAIPRFDFVAVTYGERAVLDDKGVSDAVTNLLNDTTPAAELPGSTPNQGGTTGSTGSTTTTTTTPNTTPNTTPTGNLTVGQLLARANDLFAQANAALARQDLAAFDADYKAGAALVAQATALESTGSTTTTVPFSTPPSTSSPTTTTTTKPKSGATSTSAARA